MGNEIGDDIKKPKWTNFLLNSKKRYYETLIKHNVHSTEMKLDFSRSFSDIIINQKYAVISQLKITYDPIFQDDNLGYISIIVDDMRRDSTPARAHSLVHLSTAYHQHIQLSGFEWTIRQAKCPWRLSVSVSTSGLEFGTVLGTLKVQPCFLFSSREPVKRPFCFKDLSSQNEEFQIKRVVSKHLIRPGYGCPQFSACIKGWSVLELTDGNQSSENLVI
ncbi:TPA_asm: P3 [Trifolium betacytorhabdovirus 1]|nr:TPA_asm: P3 [Trifolium betacytorhabdovirus 1]